MVSFDNQLLISDDQGIITSFSQGVMVRSREYVENARSDGEYAKFFGKGGCTHTVTIKFLNQPIDDMDATDALIKALGDNIRVGTLSIPSQNFTASNCVIDNVEIGEKELGIDNLNAQDFTYDSVWHGEYTISFRQLK